MERECYGLMCLLARLSDNDDDEEEEDIDDDNSLLQSQTEREDHNPLPIYNNWLKKG